jgi:nicotine blue oxidoreductase
MADRCYQQIFSSALADPSSTTESEAKGTVAQDMSATGVLLAAGAGVRYGMPKVRAEGGAWLRLGVSALHRGGCGDVLVVLGAAVMEVPAPARAVIAEDWAHGVSASVRAGVLAVREDAEFVVLTTVDTPDVGAAAVRRVLAAARSSDSGLARARYGDRPGHPVVIARRHWPQLLDALTGDAGAGPFLRARADVVVVDCADLGTGNDIDQR